jgi:hypothetical protein
MPESGRPHDRRRQLIREIARLAGEAVFGTLAESYRTCGSPGCRCHGPGPKHGPHLYVSFHDAGKTRGFYVPKAAEQDIRRGVAAWQEMQRCLRELADLNKERSLASAKDRAKRAS